MTRTTPAERRTIAGTIVTMRKLYRDGQHAAHHLDRLTRAGRPENIGAAMPALVAMMNVADRLGRLSADLLHALGYHAWWRMILPKRIVQRTGEAVMERRIVQPANRQIERVGVCEHAGPAQDATVSPLFPAAHDGTPERDTLAPVTPICPDLPDGAA